MTSSPAQLSLQDAADRLGVHYMTAYRYVRLGLLVARKSAGSWQVAEADLAAFIERSATERPSASSARRHSAPWAERLEHRLVAGDATGSWGVIEAALTGGADLDELYLDVIAPAMRAIGERWERGELDVALEHRASVIVMRLIGRVGHRFSRRGRTKGSVVLAAPSGETHSLPSALAADLVRQVGWEVSDLGADVPVASIVHAAKEVDDLAAVGLSVTIAANLPALRDALVALRDGVNPHIVLIVGGQAVRDEAHARELGADAFAPDGRSLVRLLEQVASGDIGVRLPG